VVLDPDARALLYWNSATTVTRYNPRDGKPLGPLELGLVSACSRDGRRVAAVSPSGRIRVYDLATGDTVLDHDSKPASGLSLSPDGSRLVASQAGVLTSYEAPSGRVLSSIPSSLVPLAYPSRGNRFLGFQPDSAGTGGSVVLADTSDASVVAVLNRAGSSFTPAFFSDSGEQIAIVRDRWDAEIVRSLRPDELPAVLNTGLPGTAEMQSLAPANIVTTTPISVAAATSFDSAVIRAEDIPVLQSHLGDHITIQGRVRDVAMITTRSAANIHFVGAEAPMVLVWVPWDTFPKLVAVLGKDLGAALNDRTIRATGRLTKYHESLEVTLDDPTNLIIVAPTAPSNEPASGGHEAGW
jgi:WD40 repeat protein